MKSKPKTISVSQLKKELMKRKGFRQEYKAQLPEFKKITKVLNTRINLTIG